MWKLLFKAQKRWPMETEDVGLDAKNLATLGWTNKLERIKSLTPLPEDPVTPQLEEMLVPTPYQPPEKKTKKKGKGPKDGSLRKGPSDAVFGENEDVFSHKEDEDEEEEEEEVESDSRRKMRRKKRTTSKNPEGAMPKREKITLSDSLDSESKHSPKRAPREKPLADT
ncbi:uncharacterized protein [Triticum aestivum]|uniref:uncharacterized protein n=1 Tax=Triticum aestivum TaxID=4565 RepID=UPI001D02C284|nr:uncharacterized protein LOC123134482 [Triticum aestivum]